MALPLIDILGSLEARIAELQTAMDALRERNRQLEEENRDLRLREAEALAVRDRAELDSKYLEVSHRLADNPDSLVETRRTIAGLIRNIDRCIAMLKE